MLAGLSGAQAQGQEQGPAPSLPPIFAQADVVILGEVHDNPAHHTTQARVIARLQPAALVFEMLSPEAAAALDGVDRDDAAAMAAALEWEGSGWPDFTLYHPLFQAAPDAAVLGAAVPPDDLRRAMRDGAAAVMGDAAARFGLDQPLSDSEQTAREALQARAHCDALPDALLPGMVAAQRLRDAAFARAALQALDRHGPPVVVITGTGHARRDWGIPAAIARAAPGVVVAALGQGEPDGAAPPPGSFDAYVIAPPPERGDPCAAFH